MRRVVIALWWAACGAPASPPAPTPHDAAAPVRIDAAEADLPPLALGLPAVDGYGWRTRAGHAAFQVARAAEARGDWPRVIDSCRAALAADPGHLEAAWLLAVALGTVGRTGEVLAPLTVAVAGDFGAWGHASLEQPALAAFRASPAGAAWARRIALDEPRYVEALGRSLVVTSGRELFAYDGSGDAGAGLTAEGRRGGSDAGGGRWYRLTRTYGAVVGGLAGAGTPFIDYVTTRGGRLQVGVIDLSRGHSSRPQELGTPGPIVIARGAAPAAGAWIGLGPPSTTTARLLDDASGALRALPPKSTRPHGPWLEVAGRSARTHRAPPAGVTADWDDRGLASAIRLAKSGRVVSVPTGQIDGDTVTWSPDGDHLAFVAVLDGGGVSAAEGRRGALDGDCAPGTPAAAAFVVDAATGTLQVLERATRGASVAWVAERRIAVAGDHGVSLVDLGGGAPTALAGATDLLVHRRRPGCTPAGGSPTPDDPEPADPDEREPDAPPATAR